MNKVDGFLTNALEKSSSDLHFISGDPARVRIHGSLTTLTQEALTTDFVRDALYEIMSGALQNDFEKYDAVDFAYEIPEVSRFRVNVMRHLNGIGAVFRAIPAKALTLEQLDMPEVVSNLCKQTQGMILVTGKTGSGKSTTLAAMIDWINRHQTRHILTIEDPVEFVHQSQQSLIRHREVGQHTLKFHNALRAALREDPDVILVGEIRDRETLSTALEASQTGHLVFGTLHTNSAVKTVERVLGMYPPDEQESVRRALSESLLGVIAQGLIRSTDAKRAAYHDILINTDACKDYIQRGALDEVEEIMERSGFDGMVTMNQSLQALVEAGRVDGEAAIAVSLKPNELAQALRGRS